MQAQVIRLRNKVICRSRKYITNMLSEWWATINDVLCGHSVGHLVKSKRLALTVQSQTLKS